MSDTALMTLIIVAYLVVIAIVGLAGTKLIRGTDDFMLAGRRLGPFMCSPD